MKMGKVKLNVVLEYAVDLDNENMVRMAKDWLWDDLDNFLCDEAYTHMIVEPDSTLSPNDIHSGLLEITE